MCTRYHHRVVALDNTHLVKLAMVSGCTLGADQSDTAATKKSWQCHVRSFLAHHLQQLLHEFNVASAVNREKHWIVFRFFHDDSQSSPVLHRSLQFEYKYAQHLSEGKCLSNRRLLSRNGLRVDRGKWEDSVHLDRKHRLYQACRSGARCAGRATLSF